MNLPDWMAVPNAPGTNIVSVQVCVSVEDEVQSLKSLHKVQQLTKQISPPVRFSHCSGAFRWITQSSSADCVYMYYLLGQNIVFGV